MASRYQRRSSSEAGLNPDVQRWITRYVSTEAGGTRGSGSKGWLGRGWPGSLSNTMSINTMSINTISDYSHVYIHAMERLH